MGKGRQHAAQAAVGLEEGVGCMFLLVQGQERGLITSRCCRGCGVPEIKKSPKEEV